MTLALAFWIVMLVWIVFGVWSRWPSGGLKASSADFVLLVLLVIVGWKVFGAPIQS